MKLRVVLFLVAFGAGVVNADDVLDPPAVTSREIASALHQEGKLERIYLFPEEFGGQDVEANVVFVPPGISEIKDQITGTLIRFVQEDLINQLVVEPEYKGNSFIPSRIKMRAWHTEKDGELNPSIEIW